MKIQTCILLASVASVYSKIRHKPVNAISSDVKFRKEILDPETPPPSIIDPNLFEDAESVRTLQGIRVISHKTFLPGYSSTDSNAEGCPKGTVAYGDWCVPRGFSPIEPEKRYFNVV